MKKLFSLMLVAVLLVGVMPFQAFADEGTAILRVFIGDGYTDIDLPAGTYSADHILQFGYSGNVEAYVLKVGYEGEDVAHQENIYVPADQFILLYVSPAAPIVCDNCGSPEHESCDRKFCEACNSWVDHNTAAHCGKCGQIECVCVATVMVQINNTIYDGSFDIKVGKNADEVFAAYKASSLAALHKDAYGPIVTLDDMVTRMNTTEAGKTYYLWLSYDEPVVTPDPEPVPGTDADPSVCSVCGKKELNDMCTGCYLDEIDCACESCKECGAPEGEEHKEDCSKHPNYNKREMTKITLNYNYKGAPRSGSFEAKKGDLLSDVIASIPAPTRDGHLFSHWTLDAEGYDSIKTERVTNGMTIFAQWDDDLAVGGNLTLKLNLNYDRKMGEPLTNIKKGTRMGDVLDYVTEPTRWGYKFMGWYWDRNCEDAVEHDHKVYRDDQIFAKWERRRNTNEIMLKIYLNENTKSVAKIVDLYDYSKDGKITKSEVDKIVKKYYTQKSSGDDMDIDGLFTVNTWHNGKYSMRNAEKTIRVDKDDETIVYVMVRDAKAITSSSSATADASNPKTGDMIMTPVMVLVASASCLAVLYYLNKKRAV